MMPKTQHPRAFSSTVLTVTVLAAAALMLASGGCAHKEEAPVSATPAGANTSSAGTPSMEQAREMARQHGANMPAGSGGGAAAPAPASGNSQ